MGDRVPNGWRYQPRRANKWAKNDTMRSAKQISNERRQKSALVEQETYLGAPPTGEDLIELRLVIPGEHLVPEGLEQQAVLNGIRSKYEVWITNDDPQVFDIRGRRISNVHHALKALNWTIHDLRLSSERPTSRFFLQQPLRADADPKITMILGCRPVVTNRVKLGPSDTDNGPIVENLQDQIERDTRLMAETLMGLGKDLQMRVNFGRLNIRQKKKGIGNEFTYPEFVNVMKPYAVRGGAGLGIKMPDTHLVDAVISHLSDPNYGICEGPGTVTTRQSLTLTVQHRAEFRNISAEILGEQILTAKMRLPEAWPRLDWAFIAPDRVFDWNLCVTAYDEVEDVPEDLQALVQRISIRSQNGGGDGGYLKLPRLGSTNLSHLRDKIGKTRLKSSAIIPFRNEPYAVEVNITQEWKGFDINSPPETTWGIELYGIHWEESINMVGADGRRKDWGEGLVNIWPGSGETMDDRFAEFLRCILQVQTAVDGLDSQAPGSSEPVSLLD